ADRLITFSLQDASTEEVLGQLLRGENYALVYDEQRKQIAKLLLLSSAAEASTGSGLLQYTDKREERTAQSLEGLTYQSSVTLPRFLAEKKQSKKAEAALKVPNIMRAHPLSVLVAPSLSGNGNVAQPFETPSPNYFPPAPTSTNPPYQNINESLAVTTRL